MSLELKKLITVADKTNKRTGQLFGDRFGGSVTVHRPTLAEAPLIELRYASYLNSCGTPDFSVLPEAVFLIARLRAILSTIAEGELPSWLNFGEVYDDDDVIDALTALFQEVTAFLESFRSRKNS